MYELLKKLQSIPSSTLRKYLETNFDFNPEEKLPANHSLLFTNQPIQKKLRLCLNPFSYGLPICKLKRLSQSDILLEEIKQIINEDLNGLTPSLYKKVVSHFKSELTDPNYPALVFISEKHAKLIFGVRPTQLQLYRKTGLLKFAKDEGSYCYSWTQLQGLFG